MSGILSYYAFSLCLQYLRYACMCRRMCRGNSRRTFYIFINNIGEVPERCTHRWLLFSRPRTMTMLFYIIGIHTFFIRVEALKLINFLQDDIFHGRNLYANSVANVHLGHSPKYRRTIDKYVILRCYIKNHTTHIESSWMSDKKIYEIICLMDQQGTDRYWH